MVYRIEILNGDGAFPCKDTQSVLSAMNDAGRRSLKVGCRSGGCGVCRVRVLSGTYDTGYMSAAEIGEQDRQDGVVLACKLHPRSDLLLVSVMKRSWAHELRLVENDPAD